LRRWWDRRHTAIAVIALVCILGELTMRFLHAGPATTAPWLLWIALGGGGGLLVFELTLRLLRGQFGSDLLAGISIVTAILLGEYLAGTLVVLMLSGGEALESFAVRRASSVLDALARRMPSRAHRKTDSGMTDIPLTDIQIGDSIIVLPHEVCPVDGVVIEGHGSMDEAYLTGEPYRISKSVGSDVLSGAINGEAALGIQAVRLPVDSRYARIMRVMQQSQQSRPRLRRLGDQLGALYTPIAVALALVAWVASGEATRFLAVLVIATPCPLLIAIPVTILGSISLAARRSIVVRDPAILERIGRCRTMIFDKTGTLTYGEPILVEQHVDPAFERRVVLQLAASLEQYSKHPLATAVIEAAHRERVELFPAECVQERPGEGLRGTVRDHVLRVTSRKQMVAEQPDVEDRLPSPADGLECMIMIDHIYAATYHFRDEPRPEGADFIGHLAPMHGFEKVMLVSGDRLSEVKYLGERVGISELHAGKSPEEKLAIVREETARNETVYVGDGINDAPAMVAATVGLAMGQRSEVITEAAGAVLMDSMLGRVDELLHIGQRMRRIALQSAVGGMALSVLGMLMAACGYLAPVTGAIAQEVIDVAAVLNALRAAWPPRALADFRSTGLGSSETPLEAGCAGRAAREQAVAVDEVSGAAPRDGAGV
jgi:heavy metal translocating P-type ATPase